MSRRTEELLQDYLDGRLSPDARERFEAEIKGDAALAARIEAYREQRRALRADVPDLSPGFYARARARFEQTVPERKPRSFPRLSWELAGLAAAAALAGILFVPGLIEWEGKGQPYIEEVTPHEPKSRTAEESPKKLEAMKEKGGIVERSREPDQAVEMEKPAVGEASDESFGLAEQEAATLQPEVNQPLGRPGTDAAVVQAPPPPSAGPIRPAAARDKKGERSAKMNQPAKRLDAMMDAEAIRVIPRPKPLELPPGAVRPGDLIVIETEEQWMNLVEGPGRDSELASIAYDPAWRWILIGSRPQGMDCAAIKIEVVAASYRITPLPPADPGRIAEWGCVLALPRDDLPVEFVGEAGDGNE